MPVLFSVGYEGRDADEVVGVLVSAGVDVLVDVRLNPISRKPGLSKTRLREALGAEGIRYLHERTLGNPKDNREAFQGPDVEQGRRRFAERLSSGSRPALDGLVELTRTGRVAVLCFERDAGRCHRQVITDVAQDVAPAIAVVEL